MRNRRKMIQGKTCCATIERNMAEEYLRMLKVMRNVHENYGGKAVCKIVWTRWPQFCFKICKNVNKKYIPYNTCDHLGRYDNV